MGSLPNRAFLYVAGLSVGGPDMAVNDRGGESRRTTADDHAIEQIFFGSIGYSTGAGILEADINDWATWFSNWSALPSSPSDLVRCCTIAP